MAQGYRVHHIRLQAPPHTVAGFITYGYSMHHIRLQAVRHEEGKQQRSAQRDANIKVSKLISGRGEVERHHVLCQAQFRQPHFLPTHT